MIRNCENEKYAHSITNASISLPRSWKWMTRAPAFIGSRGREREHRDGERQRRQRLPDDDDHAVDRRVPLGVERHDPVHGHEEDRDRVDQQPAAAEPLHPQRRVGAGVLALRPGAQCPGNARPDDEIEDRADQTVSRISPSPSARAMPASPRIWSAREPADRQHHADPVEAGLRSADARRYGRRGRCGGRGTSASGGTRSSVRPSFSSVSASTFSMPSASMTYLRRALLRLVRSP